MPLADNRLGLLPIYMSGQIKTQSRLCGSEKNNIEVFIRLPKKWYVNTHRQGAENLKYVIIDN
jgi:hypothetical protein